MNSCLWIDNPGTPLEDRQKPWLPPRIGNDWLCKRGKGNEPNEVAGYQLAVALQVPVPEHRFFVCVASCNDQTITHRKIGLLIKEVSGPKTNYSDLLKSDTESGIRHLGLRLFSTSEWPELILTESGAVAVDLEFVLAHLAFPSLDSTRELEVATDSYRDQTGNVFLSCYEEVKRHGLEDLFLQRLPQFLDGASRTFFPDFRQLPEGQQFSDFYRKCYEARCASLLDLVAVFE
ncbi:MAG: hypothetical protein U1F81_06375 [Verrucomicrobiaceae bacterium]